MKKLLILSILSLAPMVITAGTETPNHAQINQQIEEIKPPRIGVKAADVLKTESPFILLSSGKKGKKATYAIKHRVELQPLRMESAINTRVKINGKWYKEGDRVRQYTIIKVSSGEALLKSKKKELRLFQHQENDKIQFDVN
ncbi:MAG: hypothetical protein PF439_10765 [Helicobacteraceae bacterium]|jgi:hypothetical protein|nr:hypothetical protein [Helicobacteraceae bacterium]